MTSDEKKRKRGLCNANQPCECRTCTQNQLFCFHLPHSRTNWDDPKCSFRLVQYLTDDTNDKNLINVLSAFPMQDAFITIERIYMSDFKMASQP